MPRADKRGLRRPQSNGDTPVVDLTSVEATEPAEQASSAAEPGRTADAGVGPPGDLLGVCCSGGGIRSAAFNLGALQVLDRTGILRRARYLSLRGE